MASLIDIASLGRLFGQPNANPISARRFRSTALTVYNLEPTAPWRWQPQQPLGDELICLAVVNSPVVLTQPSKQASAQTTTESGFFLHPHRPAEVATTTTERTSVLCCWVPWGAVEELDDGRLEAIAFEATSPLLHGARAFASALMTTTSPTTVYTEYLVEKLIAEMAFGALLEARGMGAITGRDAAAREDRPLDRARTLMLLRRADPAFGVDELATELHLSTRQLQRLFAAAGTSPADELRRLRVESAQELLANPEFAPLTLKQIAEHAGFTTLAALRRAFAALSLEIPARHK